MISPLPHRETAKRIASRRSTITAVSYTHLAVPEGVTVVQVEDTRKAMAYMAKVLCGCPAEKLTIIGVTGTKGKTTTVHMITQTLRIAGCPAGMIGTVQIDTGKRVIESSHTTPESVEIQEYLREMADWGCTAAVIEVSSQALMLDRCV